MITKFALYIETESGCVSRIFPEDEFDNEQEAETHLANNISIYGKEKIYLIIKIRKFQIEQTMDKTSKKMGDYEHRQAVRILGEVLLRAQKERERNVVPGDQEMEIYYLLSEIQEVPKSYVLDWPASAIK